MASLPWIPFIFFALLEPLGLFSGWLSTQRDPHEFLQSSNPHVPLPGGTSLSALHTINPHAEAAILQLGNLYLFCACVQLLCCVVSSDKRVMSGYLAAAAVFDLGHVYGVYRGLGWEQFVDWQSWEGGTWGNVGFTMVLCVIRIAYLLGVFGNGKTKGRSGGKKEI